MEPLEEHDPRRIGDFEIVGRLGSGGMGQVYLGRGPEGQDVAVKVVHESLAGDREFRDRFEREVAAAKRVHSAFTAAVVAADPGARRPWMASEFIDGPTLLARVGSDGPLPAEQVLTLGAGLGRALAAIHATGMVHRDLKPSNVILSGSGPKVIDFGIARASDASSITSTGQTVGSAGFMSPEQAEGRSVGPASDMFSVGTILAFAAGGEPVFGAGPAPGVMYRVPKGPGVHRRPPASNPRPERPRSHPLPSPASRTA